MDSCFCETPEKRPIFKEIKKEIQLAFHALMKDKMPDPSSMEEIEKCPGYVKFEKSSTSILNISQANDDLMEKNYMFLKHSKSLESNLPYAVIDFW